MYRKLFAGCVAGAVACAFFGARAIPAVAEPPRPEPKVERVPRLSVNDQRMDYYLGTVVAVTEETVTVLRDPETAKTLEFDRTRPKTPQQIAIEFFWNNQWDKALARTFRVDPSLVSDTKNAYLAARLAADKGHKLKDVRLGDRVWLDLIAEGGYFDCYRLKISRRPGGKVPPADDEGVPEKCRYHNRANTRQMIEEEFIPGLPAFVFWVQWRVSQ